MDTKNALRNHFAPTHLLEFRMKDRAVLMRGQLLLSALFCLVSIQALPGHAQDRIDFGRDIRPIFAKRCYSCHGPANQEGGLRLDLQSSAEGELDSGNHAVVPGDPDSSELLTRILTDDEDERMPPEAKPLNQAEIDRIRRWINEGAEFTGHWAFQPPQQPAVPQVKDSQWPRNPIDHFILAKLESNGLRPAAPADRVAWIRRAYFDLIGLPPTPQQIDAFLKDTSEKAFERVVDELLVSEHYGEKWGRHWLDLVRYAETNGYERDSRKELVWKYRDYVIRSLNNDKPYDRFVLEQIAGDQLPDRDADCVTATGFYRLGIWDDEPADRELARYDYLDDIVRTTGETFLGLTIGCARCHDHKIDPLTQRDYYSMLAFFVNITPHGAGKTNLVPVTTDQDRRSHAAAIEKKKKREQELEKRIQTIETEFLQKLISKHPEFNKVRKSKRPKETRLFADARTNPLIWRYTTKKPPEHWFQIAFDDRKWKTGKAGFGTKGTPGSIVHTEWNGREIWMRSDFGLTEIPSKLTLSVHHDEDAEVYLNGKPIAAFKGYVTQYKTVDVTSAAKDVLQTGKNVLAVHCRQTGGGQYIDVGLTGDFGELPIHALGRKFGESILGKDVYAEWQELQKELADSRAQKVEFRTEYALAVAERGSQKTWILQRGIPAAKQQEVSTGFPSVLTGGATEARSKPGGILPGEKQNAGSVAGKRLALARWMIRPDHPLTARVIVNRVWQFHFGRGLVKTSSDFGYQGSPPTHPQLLDWLATDFVRSGWKLKSLHRKIMLSSTYRMSTRMNSRAYSKDPGNDLYWRFNIRRLTAEEIRDAILAVSGNLNLKMFGPSVYPPIPAEVLATASRPGSAWGKSPPEDAARRTIYVHVKRSLRPPMLLNFDVPDPDTPCAVRMTTTVPTQALGMLNSRFMHEQARLLANRLKKEAGDDRRAQVRLAIGLTSGRTASTGEIQEDLEFIRTLETEENLSPDKALEYYALLVLNANEFVYVE